jgi:hypothetical protein
MTMLGFKKSAKVHDVAWWDENTWAVFSEYIRLRDAVVANMSGYVPCISCGKILHWKSGDCGHFMNRKYKYTKYDTRNNNFQCRTCNRFTEGNQSAYRDGLVKKIGETAVKELEERKNWPAGFTIDGLKLMYADYKKKRDELKKRI